MKNILQAIRKDLENDNWYSALFMVLSLPDICGYLEYLGEPSSKIRYSKWFEANLTGPGGVYTQHLSGNDCYALRCSVFHNGSDIIENQKSREILDNFIFLVKSSSHCIRIGNCKVGDKRIDGRQALVLNVNIFCTDMINAVDIWIKNNESKINFQDSIFEIYEGPIIMGAVQIG